MPFHYSAVSDPNLRPTSCTYIPIYHPPIPVQDRHGSAIAVSAILKWSSPVARWCGRCVGVKGKSRGATLELYRKLSRFQHTGMHCSESSTDSAIGRTLGHGDIETEFPVVAIERMTLNSLTSYHFRLTFALLSPYFRLTLESVL